MHLDTEPGQGAFPLDSCRQSLGKFYSLGSGSDDEDTRIHNKRLVRPQLQLLRAVGNLALNVRHPRWVNENRRVDFLSANHLNDRVQTHIY